MQPDTEKLTTIQLVLEKDDQQAELIGVEFPHIICRLQGVVRHTKNCYSQDIPISQVWQMQHPRENISGCSCSYNF